MMTSYKKYLEINEGSAWGPLRDVFRTKIIEINKHPLLNNIQQIFQNNDMQLSLC